MKPKFLLSLLTLTSLVVGTQTAIAQQIPIAPSYTPSNRAPVSDNTLGTQVSATGNNFDITGGLQKGQTLFHSFTDFSIPENRAANFLNPVGNRDIITRVTGGLFSDINGLVNTNGANFFLINPSGIVFGPSATLNVGKAFVGSTANSIDLVGGGNTIKFGTNPNGDALLSVAPNVLFDVARLNLGGGAGAISNFGTLQTTNPSQYIGLIGGNVSLNGGKINAPGGRVDLGGLAAAGGVTFGAQGQAQLPTNVTRADVSLTNGARVDVAGAGGGDVAINARNVQVLGGSVVRAGIETGLGTSETVAGDIKINAIGEIVVSASNTAIENNVRLNSIGQGGNIAIDAGSLFLQDNAEIRSSTFGLGNAGNINVTANNAVSLVGNTYVLSVVEPGGVGKGGNIDVIAASLSLQDAGQLGTITRKSNGTRPAGQGDGGNTTVKVSGIIDIAGFKNGFASGIFSYVDTGTEGNGGNIVIDAGSFSLRDGAILQASTFGKGNAGNVKITATTGDVLFDGRKDGSTSAAFSTVEQGAVGKGGGLEITARNISVTNGAQLQALTKGQGDAGTVKITATTGNVLFDGSKDGSVSAAFSTVEQGAVGKGGGIEITTANLAVTNGAALAASTRGQGDAGNVKITATTGDVLFDGSKDGFSSAAFSTVEKDAVGKGGGVEITARNLSVTNGAQLQASTKGKGNAGNVKITATGDVLFDGRKDGSTSAAFSTVEQGAVGKGGGLEITARNISVTNGAQLQALTKGQGDAGTVKITATTGDVLFDGSKDGSVSAAFSTVEQGAVGKGGGVEITARNLSVTNGAKLDSSTSGQGDAGKITLDINGDINISNGSQILSGIIGSTATGNSQGIEIKNARNLTVENNSSIQTTNAGGIGNAGDIDIKTIGDINIVGNNLSLDQSSTSGISTSTAGKGDAGKITIETTGDIKLSNRGAIFSVIAPRAILVINIEGEGNSRGIEIKKARSLVLNNSSFISTSTFGIGNAGNIDIKTTGNINLSDSSGISSGTGGKGDAGKITLDTTGNIQLANGSNITSEINGTSTVPVFDQLIEIGGEGNSRGINIKNVRNLNLDNFSRIETSNYSNLPTLDGGVRTAGNINIKSNGDLSLINSSLIISSNFGTGNAGNIDIEATGSMAIIGTENQDTLNKFIGQSLSGIGSSTLGKGDAGKIKLNIAGDITLQNLGVIESFVGLTGDGNSNGIEIKKSRNLILNNNSLIRSDNAGGKGNAGNIGIEVSGDIDIIGADNNQSTLFNNSGEQSLSGVFSNSTGNGKAGNISIGSQRLKLANKSVISTTSNADSGGDINITISDLLLLRNRGFISTTSGSLNQENNGGNITINSPLIVATPGNNDIAANAIQGNGGRVDITSQGLFGIKSRLKGQDSLFTNDITASSEFGRQGAVNIDTPGTDPGKDSTELPNATTDASNQISQVCSASNRQNKLTVTGRGGLPPNANDPLTSDVVWQDARAASPQPVANNVKTNPAKLAAPAVGWVFDGKGKVTLVAAATQGQPTGTSAVCPQIK